MTDITLTRLAVRATNSPDRLHLRATLQDPHGIRGRLWFSIPLDKDPNWGSSHTLFDPESPGEDDMQGGCTATGVLSLRCGCWRQIHSIHTDEAADHLSLSVFATMAIFPEHSAVCCPAHRDVDFDPWYGKQDPWHSLAATLSLEELAAIRGCVTAHRDGIRPMAFAGLCGTAGIRATEAHLAEDQQHVESVKALVALRAGYGLVDQTSRQWFQVR